MSKHANQQKALIALLATDTIAAAAKKAGLSVDTLYKYLKDADFVREHREQRRQLMEASAGRIQKATEQAIHTLRRNMQCGNPGVEVRAAQIIYDNAVKEIDRTEILERLEALESEHSK